MQLQINKKRTFIIGFAFFGILLVWQVYDAWCPTFLTDIFSRQLYSISSAQLKLSDSSKILNVQWLVGIIMACDNLAALILLPLFGSLSDKTHTSIGKRMPYILVGTFVSAVAFPFIPLFFHKNNVCGMIITMGIVLIFMMMYRNPSVALMPDITPKPLRAKANGIINIMGYLGGACATFIGIFLKLSDYINASDADRKLFIIEIPFVVASLLMVFTTAFLFFNINENKIAVEVKDDMELGELEAQVESPLRDDAPLSKENRNMLIAILAAEFLWFMSDNAIITYIGNYVIYYLNSSSSATMILTIVGGLGSVIGFAYGGILADRIGRKWTISLGLLLTFMALIIMCFVQPTYKIVGINGEYAFPAFLYAICGLRGLGMSLVHVCSFPMVVELATANTIGRFTGYYYSASMSAQTITPILLGLILNKTMAWRTLPVYSSILTLLGLITFTVLVKNIKATKIQNLKGLEALGKDD